MPTYYSDHFSGVVSGTNAEDNTVLDEQERTDPYERHGRMRYSRAEVTIDLESGDVVRMMTLKPSDCINHMFLTCTASGAAGTVDVGLYATDSYHDGNYIEPNIFTNNRDVTSALAHGEIWNTGAPTTTAVYRGKPLWEVVSAPSAQGSYTKDPGKNWDVTLYGDVATTNATTFVLEVYFTSGD